MASSSALSAEDCDNSVANQPLEDADDASVRIQARKTFRIDTSKIESVPHSLQNAELQDLDLHVYNQDTFEQGYMILLVFLSLHIFTLQY